MAPILSVIFVAVQASGKLAQAMENISAISLAVENSIKEIRHYLDEDKVQEDEYIDIVGEGIWRIQWSFPSLHCEKSQRVILTTS